MEYTERILTEILNDYIKELDGNLKIEVPVLINTRLKTTLGRVKYSKVAGYVTPTQIEFSKKFLENATDEEIENVMKHELSHYYVIILTHKEHNHSTPLFKQVCEQLNCNSSATTKVSLGEKNYKYTIKCAHCGKVIGHYQRAGNVVKYPQLCKSKCCGAPIEVIQNY